MCKVRAQILGSIGRYKQQKCAIFSLERVRHWSPCMKRRQAAYKGWSCSLLIVMLAKEQVPVEMGRTKMVELESTQNILATLAPAAPPSRTPVLDALHWMLRY